MQRAAERRMHDDLPLAALPPGGSAVPEQPLVAAPVAPAARKRRRIVGKLGRAFLRAASRQLVAGAPQKVVVREILREVDSQAVVSGRRSGFNLDGLSQ